MVIGIIPARYASSRFPAKMLAPIHGKTLLQRTYESAKESVKTGVNTSASLDALIIATDDERIYAHAQEFGATCYMTPASCRDGTERIVALLNEHPDLAKSEIIVNIQGDRPCIARETIDSVVHALKSSPKDVVATPVVKMTAPHEIMNPASVKCVFTKEKYALYFSRSPIPTMREGVAYYKHVGIYAYRPAFLLELATLPHTPLQQYEDLEQLKVLEHGYAIKVVEVAGDDPSVDYPEDIFKIEKLLC